MTCSEFENMIDLLVADELTDEITRQRAIKHSSTCADCSRRLADGRIISASLAALAEETGHTEAPARIKMALQKEFAGMLANNQHDMTVQSPKNIVTFPLHRFQRRAVLTVAAAASLVALVALTWQLWLPAFTIGNPETIAIVPLPIPSPSIAPSVPGTGNSETETVIAKTEPVSSSRRRPTRTVEAKSDPEMDRVDFIPLTYVSDTASLHSGTVVRVEVQRTTLLAMGLPVNDSRDDSLIKADLIVGDDGVARAIRFVQ